MKIATIKLVQDLFDKQTKISKTTAWRLINECRDALGKQKHEFLSLDEFTKHFGINPLNS